ncbi:hypothetical protein [Enhygromyxa salina]|uniref:Lipoprotein n=1 Tax=Enhygromyxa salina TaxID=215803 RepID=A0A2S9YRG5_9BACT|nr:hypothetical protein [Enhygromyxa salina]PRQ07687.1 hypothetical protein ENSA7_26770 [Enhygromyxa salina]
MNTSTKPPTTKHVWRFALAGLLICGCGKKDEVPEGAPSGERTQEPLPEVPKDAPSGPFASFDFEAAEASWQGSWTLDGEVAGKQVAWMIDGATLVEFDGTAERKLEFSLYSPCQITYTDVDEGVTVYKSFTFVRDTLHAGLGSSGTVAGDTVIACHGGKTYVLDGAGTCLAWTERFDDWKSAPATCSVEGEGEARKFVVDGREIEFLDDASLGTLQMKNNVATKHANFAAAKAALASAAPPPPADAI